MQFRDDSEDVILAAVSSSPLDIIQLGHIDLGKTRVEASLRQKVGRWSSLVTRETVKEEWSVVGSFSYYPSARERGIPLTLTCSAAVALVSQR